jgi:biopolymer transport protein ExbB
LGTVVGILLAFEVMAATGMANPADFAKGIYLALITTVGGLVVAIPHYIAHSYLLGYLDKIEVGLEKSVSQRIISN